MKRNNTTRLIIVLIVVVWSIIQIIPPTSRDIIQHFKEKAHVPARDAAFTNIVERAEALRAKAPSRGYANLKDAVGTNDIIKYFPFFGEAKTELYPTTYILNRLQRQVAGKIKLGLDLQGGTSFLVEMDTNRLETVETVIDAAGKPVVDAAGNPVTTTNRLSAESLAGVLNQAVEVVRKRVDRFGVAEPVIQPAGENQILIQLPGLSDADKEGAKKQIQRAAFLQFRLVHELSDELIRNGEVPPGYELLKRKSRSRDGTESLEQAIVKKAAERGLTGTIIRSANVSSDNFGQPTINFTLNDEGTTLFGLVTRENVGRRLAIVLDGELYSAPNINSPIETGRGEITGGFDRREAYELANVLENPLRAPLRIVYSDDVDPTLGAESIRSGISASMYGVIAVAAFMLCYYLLSGMVANVALILNVIILLGVMCSVGTTFTLPGIAGIVLTIGMAVDANVLIYERIREEQAKGKSLRGAIAAGYDRAFGTIFDSHVTTLISSIILIFMGTGSVKGFGVALTIGVAASLFTALVVTRLIFDWLLDKNVISSLKMLHFIRETKIDFMRWALPAFIASWLLIVAGVSYGIFGRGSDVLGVQFSGGDSITLNFDQTQDISTTAIGESVKKLGMGEPLISYQRNVATSTRTLRVTVRDVAKTAGSDSEATAKNLLLHLQADFPNAKFEILGQNHVGATVGADLRNTAILASVLAMFGILVYVAFRYEFSFAVAAVVAILHDVFMTLGCYFLSGRELNDTTVAAMLTIIGFSINDTIVIFDRIREDLKLGVRGTFRELVNQALNQTLSRTIITSGTVLLATLSLFIFGGGPINDFAFTFLVGILTGTYSSIYIASALVLWWHKGQRPNIGSGQLSVAGTAAPATAKP